MNVSEVMGGWEERGPRRSHAYMVTGWDLPAVDLVYVQFTRGGAMAGPTCLHLSQCISWVVLHWRVGAPHLGCRQTHHQTASG